MKNIIKIVIVCSLLSLSLAVSAAHVSSLVLDASEHQAITQQQVNLTNKSKLQAVEYIKTLFHTKQIYLKSDAKLISLNKLNSTSCDPGSKEAVEDLCAITGECIFPTAPCIAMWACHWSC